MSRSRKSMFTEINITPLTDIFLVLLIIMMVIAPMLDSKGLKLAVPSVDANKETQGDPKALTLHIADNGAFTANGEPIPAADLAEHLAKVKSTFPDGLILEPTPKCVHGSVVAAMDAARTAGMTKIAVVQAQMP